jgi:hypothetical protein
MRCFTVLLTFSVIPSMDDSSEEPNLQHNSHNAENNQTDRPKSIDFSSQKSQVTGMSGERQNE